MSETDGVQEAVDGVGRAALTVAARVGEELSRGLEDRKRRTEAALLQEAREDQARARATAAVLRPLPAAEQPSTVRASESERAQQDRELAEAVRELGAAADRDRELASESERAQQDRELGEAVREMGAAADRERQGREVADAQLILNEAERGDQAANAQARDVHQAHDLGQERGPQPEVAYDSVERREANAADLRAQGVDDELVDTHLRADMGQGKPATEAVRQKQSTRARKGKSVSKSGREQQLTR